MSIQRRPRRHFEINIVPYVDVMLVLLLVFMVSASAWVQELMVELPTTEGNGVSNAPKGWTITINKKGEMAWSKSDQLNIKEKVNLSSLTLHLKNTIDKKPHIIIQADKAVPYESVAKVLSVVQKEGVQNVHLMTEIA